MIFNRINQGKLSQFLVFIAGALGVLAFEPFGQFWLLFPVLAVLFAFLSHAQSWQQGAWRGALFGLGFFLAGVSWVYVSLSLFGNMPPPLAGLATFLFCICLALFPAFLGGVFYRFKPQNTWGQVLLFAALWALVDILRGWLFTGFPWLALGYSQAPPSPLAGFAPLIGVYGLSFLVALGSACLLWRPWGVLGIALLLAGGAGLRLVEWTQPVGNPVSVALVQGNVPQDVKWLPERFASTLLLYHQLIKEHPAQLTILPETSLPVFFQDVPRNYLAELKTLAQRQDGDILLGVPTGEYRGPYWNSAVSLGTSPAQIYSKSHLVPFGEFIPPGFSWFLSLADIPMSNFSPGPVSQPLLELAGQRVAVNICYEDVFGRELIRALPEATLLVNMSNTAWFGDSLAQPQHLQIAQLRALEMGRPMLRATNTGMTAVVTPDGRVSAVLPPFTTDVLVAQVQGYGGLTPYGRYGDWGVLGLVLLILVYTVWSRKSLPSTEVSG